MVLHTFLIAMSILWLFPLLWAVYTSLRPYSDTAERGYVSLPGTLNIDNYVDAWNGAELPRYFLNSLVIVVPAVIMVLFLASMMAFAVSRYSWRFNLLLLMLFTALNLLPPQVIITPLFRIYLNLPLPRTCSGSRVPERQRPLLRPVHRHHGHPRRVPARLLHVRAEQLHEDVAPRAQRGRGRGRRVGLDDLPQDHHAADEPALAALATLQVTCIYNDFFWALMLMPDRIEAADHVRV